MTDAERELNDRKRQYRKAVRRAPGVQANRLAKLERQLREDDLLPYQRADKERAVEGLHEAFRAEVRCRDCGRPLSDPVSVARNIGPECIRKTS